MTTPHNSAKLSDIKKTVLMPGDPLRAKYIATKYLDNYRLVNEIRNMFCYTGIYKGHEITIMASGMGMPSMGIYSHELFKFYNVENIIRIGSAGSYTKDLNLYDIVLAKESYTDSNYFEAYNGIEKNIISSSNKLNDVIINTAKELNIKINFNKIHTSDLFYHESESYLDKIKNQDCSCVEMETFALLSNAYVLNKNATALLTISDSLVTKEEVDPKNRETSFDKMIELALESAIKL